MELSEERKLELRKEALYYATRTASPHALDRAKKFYEFLIGEEEK